MKHYLTVILSLLILFSCSSQNKFELIGTVKNVPDSTSIKLIDGQTQKTIDSTLIINEKFLFFGNFKQPTITTLYIDKTKDYMFLWVENNKMTLSGEKGNFNKSLVTGSKTQKEFETYNKLVKSITYKRDSILNIFRNPNINDSIKNISLENAQKTMETIAKQELSIIDNFIITHPNSYFSLSLLKSSKQSIGKLRTKQLFSGMNRQLRETENGIKIFEFLEVNNIKIGDSFIDFNQENTKNENVNLSNLLGKYTLLEFWASWCLPCRQNNPALVETYKKYKNSGFHIIGVSLDFKKENWIKAIRKDKLPWINLSDLKGRDNKAAILYGINGIPDNFLINPEGIIIGRDLTASELNEKLENIFEKKASR